MKIMINEFITSFFGSLTISLIIVGVLGIISKVMSKTENNETVRLKLQILSLPVFTLFVIPFIMLTLMYVASDPNDTWGLAEYVGWMSLIGLSSFLSLIHIQKYNSEEKLLKFKAHRFIIDHVVMKYSLGTVIVFAILFSVLISFLEESSSADNISDFLLYSLIYLFFMIMPSYFLFFNAMKLNSTFVYAKAYCMQFGSSSNKQIKISHLNQTLKKYNSFLEKKYGFAIKNRLEIIQKYMTHDETFKLLNANLLSKFDYKDQNKPMDFIFKEFKIDDKMLRDYSISDKIKKISPIFSISIPLILFATAGIMMDNGPDMVVTNSYMFYEPVAKIDTVFKVEVFNQGNKVAEKCRILFDHDILDSNPGVWSNFFSVIPDKSYELELNKIRYEEPGQYDYSTAVECKNNPVTEPLIFGISIEKHWNDR